MVVTDHGSDVYIDPSQLGQAAAPRAVHVPLKERAGTAVDNGDGSSASEAPAQKVNTTSLDDTVEFQTSAHELYDTLLNPQRVAIWTRGPAKIAAEVGSKFELFNGNVSGEIKEIVSVILNKERKNFNVCIRSLIRKLFNRGDCDHGQQVGKEETVRYTLIFIIS